MFHVHYSFNLDCYSFFNLQIYCWRLYKVKFTLLSSVSFEKHRQLCNYHCKPINKM